MRLLFNGFWSCHIFINLFLCISIFTPIFFGTSEGIPLTVFGINTIKIYSVPQFDNSHKKPLCLCKVFPLFGPVVLKENLTVYIIVVNWTCVEIKASAVV